MATPIVSFGAAAGGFVSFVEIPSQNVGSGAGRVAYVAIGATNTTDVPSSVTVGTDTLTAQGTVFTDGNGWRFRLYAGLLTVTGLQTVRAEWTSEFNIKLICGLVMPDVGATIIEGLATGNALTSTQQPTFTVASRVGDTVVSLVFLDAEATFTATSPAVATTGTGLGGSRSAHGLYRDGAATVSIEGTVGGPTNVWRGFGFNVPAGGPAGPTITDQFDATTVTAPNTAQFSFTYTGSITGYQIQRSTDNGVTWGNVPDGTNASGGAGAGATITYTTTATAVSTGNHRNGYRYRPVLNPAGTPVNGTGAILTVNPAPLSITTEILRDKDGNPRIGYTVSKVYATRLTDDVQVKVWTNVVTNGEGRLVLTDAALSTVDHLISTYTAGGIKPAGARVYLPG